MHLNDLNYENYSPPRSFLCRFLISPVTLGIVLVVLAGTLVWHLFAHPSSVDEKDLPVIKAEAGALKYRPPNAGELTVPHQDKLIYNRLIGGEAEKPTPEKFLPLPEKPLAGLPAASIALGDEAPADDHPDAIVFSENKTSSESTLPMASDLSNDEIASLISAIDASTSENHPEIPTPIAKPLQSPSAKTELPLFYHSQLGAYPTLEKAKKAWQSLLAKNKKTTKGIVPAYIKRSDKKSKVTSYVLQAGPFKQKQKAQEMCRLMDPIKGNKTPSSCRVISVEEKQ